MTSLRRGWQLFGTLGAIAAALGCAGTPRAEKTVPVVVTFYPLQEFPPRAGGERVRVVTLVPPGAAPHDYEPRPPDILPLLTARSGLSKVASLGPGAVK